jgi:hypothetical protein
MLEKKTWDELSPIFPDDLWDEFMRFFLKINIKVSSNFKASSLYCTRSFKVFYQKFKKIGIKI